MRKLFVSYARENRPHVDELVRHLDALGYEPWVDTALRGGQTWWDEILRRISECDVFTAIVSPNSLNSVACKRELKWALALGKPVLPIAVERLPEALPRDFSVRQIVDYSEPGQEAAFALAGALTNLPPAPALPEPLPEPPAAPLSYLTDLVDQVSQPDPLSHEQQHQILTQIQPALRSADPEEQRGAHYILDTFSRREEIYADVGRTLVDWGINDQVRRAENASGYPQALRTDPPQQVSGSSPQPPSRPKPSAWMWAAIFVAALVGFGIVGFFLFRPKIDTGHRDEANQAQNTQTVIPTYTQTMVPTDTQRVIPTGTEAVPPYSTPCPEVFSNNEFPTSAVGSAATSCEFAEAVRFQYVSQPQRGTTVSLDANSPVTGQTYRMTCSGDRVVTCTGGNNALIFLY